MFPSFCGRPSHLAHLESAPPLHQHSTRYWYNTPEISEFHNFDILTNHFWSCKLIAKILLFLPAAANYTRTMARYQLPHGPKMDCQVTVVSNQPPSPDLYFATKVPLWMPYRLWQVRLECENSACEGHQLTRAGTYKGTRKVLDLDRYTTSIENCPWLKQFNNRIDPWFCLNAKSISTSS